MAQQLQRLRTIQVGHGSRAVDDRTAEQKSHDNAGIQSLWSRNGQTGLPERRFTILAQNKSKDAEPEPVEIRAVPSLQASEGLVRKIVMR